MNAAAWVALAGVVGQFIISTFFFGVAYQKLSRLVTDMEGAAKRDDAFETRLNDHGTRLTKLETRIDK